MTVEVLKLEVTVGVQNGVRNHRVIIIRLRLIGNDGGFSVNPVFGFEEGEGDALISVVLESNFTCASVPRPVLVGLLAVVVYDH